VASITKLGRVIIPVSDQDAAIAFYTQKLGFSVASDIPFGNGDRWSRWRRRAAEPRSRSRGR